METPETADAGVLRKLQSTGETRWIRQHPWSEWAADILGQDPCDMGMGDGEGKCVRTGVCGGED